MVRIAAELVCDRTVFFDNTHYVKMSLSMGGREVPGSQGLDIFACEGAVLPGGRLAATGRQNLVRHADYAAGSGLGPVNAARPGMVGLEDSGVPVPEVWVETNIVLDPGEFRQWFSLRITRLSDHGIQVKEVPLRCPVVRVEWPARGKYIVDVTGAV